VHVDMCVRVTVGVGMSDEARNSQPGRSGPQVQHKITHMRTHTHARAVAGVNGVGDVASSATGAVTGAVSGEVRMFTCKAQFASASLQYLGPVNARASCPAHMHVGRTDNKP
jgi:hypothetical protein